MLLDINFVLPTVTDYFVILCKCAPRPVSFRTTRKSWYQGCFGYWMINR